MSRDETKQDRMAVFMMGNDREHIHQYSLVQAVMLCIERMKDLDAIRAVEL